MGARFFLEFEKGGKDLLEFEKGHGLFSEFEKGEHTIIKVIEKEGKHLFHFLKWAGESFLRPKNSKNLACVPHKFFPSLTGLCPGSNPVKLSLPLSLNGFWASSVTLNIILYRLHLQSDKRMVSILISVRRVEKVLLASKCIQSYLRKLTKTFMFMQSFNSYIFVKSLLL